LKLEKYYVKTRWFSGGNISFTRYGQFPQPAGHGTIKIKACVCHALTGAAYLVPGSVP